jgi:hypothetical protein
MNTQETTDTTTPSGSATLNGADATTTTPSNTLNDNFKYVKPTFDKFVSDHSRMNSLFEEYVNSFKILEKMINQCKELRRMLIRPSLIPLSSTDTEKDTEKDTDSEFMLQFKRENYKFGKEREFEDTYHDYLKNGIPQARHLIHICQALGYLPKRKDVYQDEIYYADDKDEENPRWRENDTNYMIRDKMYHLMQLNQLYSQMCQYLKSNGYVPEMIEKYSSHKCPEINMDDFASGKEIFESTFEKFNGIITKYNALINKYDETSKSYVNLGCDSHASDSTCPVQSSSIMLQLALLGKIIKDAPNTCKKLSSVLSHVISDEIFDEVDKHLTLCLQLIKFQEFMSKPDEMDPIFAEFFGAFPMVENIVSLCNDYRKSRRTGQPPKSSDYTQEYIDLYLTNTNLKIENLYHDFNHKVSKMRHLIELCVYLKYIPQYQPVDIARIFKDNKDIAWIENSTDYSVRKIINQLNDTKKSYVNMCQYFKENNFIVDVIDKYSSYPNHFPEINVDDFKSVAEMWDTVQKEYVRLTNSLSGYLVEYINLFGSSDGIKQLEDIINTRDVQIPQIQNFTSSTVNTDRKTSYVQFDEVSSVNDDLNSK